ncbi:hypothetical protein EXN22_21975 [Pseudomonas tructae]|uniref:Lipoprotein n=1 Tax=Pseudomonas tructae TaxID=2518644 RepID=A0A411MN26_9PSED|nr:hypothetical protein [Pseudomonas tructae]QBF28225.1 hypothetical protein EXN22_21975 [Pseudomonas tructae]
MYRRLLLIAVLGLLTTACVPYAGNGYYRTEVYTADRYGYPGYYRPAYPYNRGYYVAPQPRYYVAPPPRYYAPPPHYYRPAPHGYYREAPHNYYKPYPGRGYDRDRQGSSRHERSRDGWPDRNWRR